MNKLSVKTTRRIDFIDITADIRKIVNNSNVKDGICCVFVPHTTAGITINENADPDVVRDINKHLSQLVPESSGFAHSEGNSDSHIKASILGFSQNVIIESGNLVLGTWQGIYFAEFDGPRQRNVFVKIIT